MSAAAKRAAAWLTAFAGRRKHPHTVRYYLVLLALAVAIPLVGLAFYVSSRVAAAERQATRAALLNDARSLAAAVDQEIGKHIAVASTLAYSRALLSGNWPEFRQEAAASLAVVPESWLTVVDPHGQVLLNTLVEPEQTLPRRPLWTAEQRALATGRPTVSVTITGLVAHRTGAFAAVPVFRGGTPIYVLDIALNPTSFARMLREQHYPNDWLIGIVDRRGDFVARTPDEGAQVGQPASPGWRAAIRRSPEGIAEHPSLKGYRIVDAYAPSAFGWTVGVAIRQSALDAPLWRTWRLLLAASIGCIALGLLCAWLVARRLHRSATLLRGAAISIADGLPVAARPTGVREYDEAIAGFAAASQALRAGAEERDRAEAALARNADEQAALYEFSNRLYRAESPNVAYAAALDAIVRALHCSRASVLRLDRDGTARVVAWRGLTERCRKAVERHSPRTAADTPAQPVCVGDTNHADLPDTLKASLDQEGIRALSFFPLTWSDSLLAGEFAAYYETPHAFSRDEIDLALHLARRIGFAVERIEAEQARRLAEQKLRELTEKLESEVETRTLERDRIWNVSEDLLGVSNFEGYFVSINPAWSKLLGWSEEEIKSVHVNELRHPEDTAASVAARARLAQGVPRVRVENRFRHKDGSWRWIQWTMAAENGLIYLSGRHVTMEREAAAALQRAQRRSAHSQKMEALGQLTGGVAHDFNNLLMIVSGHAQTLKRRLTDSKQLRALEAIQVAATRGENLTRQLLSFSRGMPLNPTVIDPAATIQAFRDMLAGTLHVNIELSLDVAPTTWPVRVDKSELELALLNLAVNARDAMPDGGHLSISSANVSLVADDTPEGLSGDFVALSVTDTGVGIADDVLGRVFEPFFTTKGADRGTGLGLSQVYGFARRSGGTAVIKNGIDCGTVVTVYLPRSLAAAEIPLEEDAGLYAAPTDCTVLVVEDNADVRAIAVSLLEQLGYRTIAVGEAGAALETLAMSREIGVVFSDVVLPGESDGLSLARTIKARYPRIPVVLTTGYARVFESEAEFPVLRKPYRIAALGRVMRDAFFATIGDKSVPAK